MEVVYPSGRSYGDLPPDEGIYPASQSPIESRAYRRWRAMAPSMIVRAEPGLHALRMAMDETDDAPSAAMALGSAVHARILEPDRAPLLIATGGPTTGPTSKGWLEWAAEAEANDQIPLHHADADKLERMVASCRRHPDLRAMLSTIGARECAITWTHAEYPLRMKGRLDWLLDGAHGFILDLKTTRSWGDREWSRDMAKFHYAEKLSLYQDGVHALTGQRLPVFIAWGSNSPPYPWAVRRVGDKSLEVGRVRVNGWINDYLDAHAKAEAMVADGATNPDVIDAIWWADRPAPDIPTMELPLWRFSEYEEGW
jgi:hypothetical protein